MIKTPREFNIDLAVLKACKFLWSHGGNLGALCFAKEMLVDNPKHPVSEEFVANVRSHFRESINA